MRSAVVRDGLCAKTTRPKSKTIFFILYKDNIIGRKLQTSALGDEKYAKKSYGEALCNNILHIFAFEFVEYNYLIRKDEYEKIF